MRPFSSVLVLWFTVSVAAQGVKSLSLDGKQRPILITTGHVYSVARDPAGFCSGGPIVSQDSVFGRFTPAAGAAATQFGKHCHLTAIGYNPTEGVLYVVAANGVVVRVKPDATFGAPYATLVDSAGELFEAADLEFDGAGNAYLLKAGDRRRVYRVAKAAFAVPQNGKITVGAATATLPQDRPLALASSGSAVSLVSLDASARLVVTKLTAAGGLGLSALYAAVPGPLTEDLSAYTYGGYWYAFKGGTLYRTKTMGGTAAAVGNPEVAYASHDVTLLP